MRTAHADDRLRFARSVPPPGGSWPRGSRSTRWWARPSSPLVVKKELFGQLRLPLAFTDCDRTDIPVTVHHAAEQKAPDRGGRSRRPSAADRSRKRRRSNLRPTGISELQFSREFLIPRRQGSGPRRPPPNHAERIDFETHRHFGRSAGTAFFVRCRSCPTGPQVFAAGSGSATGDTTAWIEARPSRWAPCFTQPEDPPSAQRSSRVCSTTVFGIARPVLDFGFLGCSSPTLRTAADLMAALALQGPGRQKPEGSDRPEMLRLDREIREAIASLIASQKKGRRLETGRAKRTRRTAT